MIQELVLRDGTPAIIWPLAPSDGKALRHRYGGLSAETKFSRFLSSTPALTDRMLARLVDEVDGFDHVALILSVFPAVGIEEAVGIGRIVRYPSSPTQADIAVTVEEAWQRKGVASALLVELVKRRPSGVTELMTEVAEDNAASLAMLHRLGTLTTVASGSGSQSVSIRLPAT